MNMILLQLSEVSDLGSIPGQVSEFFKILFVEFVLLDKNYEKNSIEYTYVDWS